MNQFLPISVPPGFSREPLSLIDELLSEQQRLTAVDRFARVHAHIGLPAQARHYRDLIPLSSPGPGQQYAFEVDLEACSGCKSCVTACHSLNGLDEDESWRSVGLLVGGSRELPVLQHVTGACHHCLEPACLEGCPVNAYAKDSVTGIVRHLDDQCIGCQYCILKCPYDVPRYNKRLGIVRKCDMCSDRLSAGEAPACVQACPNQAIRIALVDKERVIEESEANVFLPGAAAPDYTLPTTNYKTRRALPRNLLAADHRVVHPHDAHPALTIMLVLTQLSVGAFLVQQVLQLTHGNNASRALGPIHAAVSLSLGLLALAASTLHLGRPLYAFRAVIGLRTSWLSREIVGFGIFSLLAGAYAVEKWVKPASGSPGFVRGLGYAVVVCGVASVGCSIMIYHDTRRACWHIYRTGVKFTLTALILGLATLLLSTVIAELLIGSRMPERIGAANDLGAMLCRWLAGATLAKLCFECLILLHLRDRGHGPLKSSALLLVGPLRKYAQARCVFGTLGGVLLPLVLAYGHLNLSTSHDTGSFLACLVVLIFVCTLIGELLERHLFFTSAVAPKMPGMLDG